MKQKKLFNLVCAAIFAALVFAVTRISLPIGAGGYIHLGDSMIYLAVLVLPLPYALSAAAIGAGFADLTAGYALYILPTIIIKSLLVLAGKGLKRVSEKNMIQNGLICATGIITIIGYYVADVLLALLSGSSAAAAFSGSLQSVPFNTIQAVASAALYLLLAPVARKALKN